jgi:menaquinone-dependent protoporphyrinogen oxidase
MSVVSLLSIIPKFVWLVLVALRLLRLGRSEEKIGGELMPNKLLVTYATRYGSTREVADKVAAVLREGGLDVDLQPMRQVRALDEYRAVVLGAPLYIGSLLKDAQSFLARHQAALAARPTALFVLGPTFSATDEKERQDTRAQLDQALLKLPWLKPVAVELFGGKYDPAKLRFPDSLLASLPASPLHGAPPTDLRDWGAIGAWASGLVERWR